MITQTLVQELFNYDPLTGIVTRKITTNYNSKAGDVVGWKTSGGKYLAVSIQGKAMYIHRLAYLFTYGYLPKFIDHINGNRTDNRIDNLRECTQSQNGFNKKSTKSKSGIKNVVWHKNEKKWHVQITVNRKKHNFGYFKCIKEAEKIAVKARIELHGEFARHE